MSDFKFNRLYALALVDFAETHDLSDVYQQIWSLVLSGQIAAEHAASEDLRSLLEHVPPGDLEDVLLQFLDMARKKMSTLPVEVISAVPLTQEQLFKLEIKLIRLLRKQLSISTHVDASLLGGVRILVDNTVIDMSIKRQLSDMKQMVYKGVYLH